MRTDNQAKNNGSHIKRTSLIGPKRVAIEAPDSNGNDGWTEAERERTEWQKPMGSTAVLVRQNRRQMGWTTQMERK